MSLSYGFIETQGLIGSIEAADAMLKAAKVHLVEKREIGFGLVTIIIEGELGAVQAAIDAGSAAAERVGQLISSHVIARPFNDTEALVRGMLVSRTPRPSRDKADRPAAAAPSQRPGKKKRRDTKPQKSIQPPLLKSENPSDDNLIDLLRKNPGGLTLPQLSEELNLNTREIRIRLKRQIDNGKVEKVQQRYFLI